MRGQHGPRPDPKLVLRAREGFDHPALAKLWRGDRALVAGGCQQAFDGERHGLVGGGAGDQQSGFGQGVAAEDLGEQGDSTAAALAEFRAQGIVGEGFSLCGQQGAGVCCGLML